MRRSRSESSGRGRIQILVQPAFDSEHSLHRWCCARRDWQPSSTQCAMYNPSPLFVRKPPRGAVGSRLPSTSCVCKKIFLVNQICCAAPGCCLDILPRCPRGGAARCDGGPAASPLAALMCKMPSRGSGLGQRAAHRVLATVAWVVVVPVVLPRGRRRDFDRL